MSAARALAVGRLAFRANLRAPVTRFGLAAAGVVILGGPATSALAGRGWTVDPGFAFYGFLVALVLGLRSGLEDQRERDFDLFLVHNLCAPLEHAAAMLVSLGLLWALLVGGVFAALMLVSADPGLATWHAAAWGLRSAVVVGFVPLVERAWSFRLPFFVPAFGYLTALVALSILLGEDAALGLLVVTHRADPATLLPLAMQAGSVTAAAIALFLALAVFRPRRGGRFPLDASGHGPAPPRR